MPIYEQGLAVLPVLPVMIELAVLPVVVASVILLLYFSCRQVCSRLFRHIVAGAVYKHPV